MKKLTIAGVGAPPTPQAHMLFLMDDEWYPQNFFDAHFEEVQPGAGVARVERQGQPGYQLDDEGKRALDALAKQELHALFYTSSDTHVKTFGPVAELCDRVTYVLPRRNDHSARKALQETQRTWEMHSGRMPTWSKAHVAITGNDWGPEDRVFVDRARAHGVPSVCLQESIIDLDDDTGRMRWADYALIQGPFTFRYLKRQYSYLVGNPRYDSIEWLPVPESPSVFINCNFTFGVHEEAGRPWIDDVTTVAQELALPYIVSVHPRCYIDLSGIDPVVKSNAFLVHEQLRTSSIIVTRFSSLAHEALLMGRHVIYYNPHGEAMRYLNEDATGLLLKAYTKDELRRCFRSALASAAPVEYPGAAAIALRNVFCSTDHRNHARCALALRAIAAHHGKYVVDDLFPTTSRRVHARFYRECYIAPVLRRVTPLRKAWHLARKIESQFHRK